MPERNTHFVTAKASKMDAARKAGHIYFIRWGIVVFALPGLPILGFLAADALGFPGIVSLLFAFAMFVPWGFLARRLLAKYRTLCPQCEENSGRIESINEIAFLVCSSCGFKKETGYDFKDAGG